MENTVGLTLGRRAVDVSQVTGQGHTLSTGAPVLTSHVGSLKSAQKVSPCPEGPHRFLPHWALLELFPCGRPLSRS